MKAQEERDRVAVEQYIKANGLSRRSNKADGGLRELMRILPDGTLLYYETTNADAARSTRTDYLNSGGGLGLSLDGDNLTAHVWDGGHARASHREYDGPGGTNRISIGDTPLSLNFHAAHVTGTIASSGAFDADSKGMAPEADAVSYDWNSDTSEAATATLDATINNGFGMLVSNHSYGFGMRDGSGNPQLADWFLGRYFDTARDWDEVMYDAPYYLMVGSAGNDGNDNTA